jgi:RNA polymerase sigma-70 factor (ECF subfamily)
MKPADIQRLADEEVMVLLRDGNADAFEVIYDRHGGAAFALRRNIAHDRRRVTVEGLEERQEAPERERTEVEVARRDEAREVREAMKELPGEQLEVVRLAYFGGFTHTEIAGMLDQPIGTVKGRMRLGLEKMRRALSPEEAAT